ncbi:Rv0909 family putative TA system antitoxin [Microcella flavibacter]|uniref:Rv0909 family putative TA system antitoxin n=1 Tax=Microcella flavibacter TaxID=1804990 RepID=UPI001456E51A|nr:Rv0909 family putative TA system antitoxin [Microcella flavibacter]
MAIDDITKKAQEFLNDEKVKGMLASEQAEGVSDKVLDGVAGLADSLTGGKFSEQIDDVKGTIDEKIGDE